MDLGDFVGAGAAANLFILLTEHATGFPSSLLKH